MLRFATLYRTCGMNHVNVRQHPSHLSISSPKIQTRYFISPLANMHIKKHWENHTEPSGEAKLELWLLNTSTLNAPTTRLEGIKAICVHWKAKALSPAPFSHSTFPPGCRSISEAGRTPDCCRGIKQSWPRCRLAPRHQPTVWHRPEPPGVQHKGIHKGFLPTQSLCFPRRLTLMKFVISLLVSETTYLRSFG